MFIKTFLGQDINYEELTPDEKETYKSWLTEVEKMKISPEMAAAYVTRMKNIVAKELAELPDNKKNQTKNAFLKARLMNYTLFEEFFATPQRAREELERRIGKVPVTSIR